MPGITGIIGFKAPASQAPSPIEPMVRCLAHESFYSVGTASTDQLGIRLGWASHGDFSDATGFVWNERKDIGLLFLGDDFPRAASTNSAAARLASLLRRYEEIGARFLGELNGPFCGLIVDLRADRAILFNDRYGLNRLYYAETAGGFYFSSEAKSLLAVLPQTRQIDQRGLAEFFSVGCVLQNRSLYRDISLLPGGSAWTFHWEGRVEKSRYFEAAVWENQPVLDVATYTEKLIDVFSQVVPRYYAEGETKALSLTGGLDSRMLLAWARVGPGALPCYSFSGPIRDCADVQIARQLAALAHQPHSTLRINDDFYRDFPALAEKTVRISDGCMDVSGAVELYVNRQARSVAPIRLTGNYGSEILRSNVAFKPRAADPTLYTPAFNELLHQAAETYRAESVGLPLSFIAFKQVPWHHHARYSIERSQLTPRSPFLDNELVALAYQAPPALAQSAQPLLALIAAGNPQFETVPTDRRLQRGRSAWTQKLQQQWQELTAKAEYAYDYGMPRRLAQFDHLVSRLRLEKLFLGRHKFYHFRSWYKYPLRDYLEALASDPSNHPPCYRPDIPQRLVSEHLSGQDNHTLQLHKYITVSLVYRSLREFDRPLDRTGEPSGIR